MIGALLLAVMPAAAQQQADTIPAYRLRPIEVSVLRGVVPDVRAAAAVTALGRGEIQGAQPTVGLDEALALVPGVVVNNRYNFSLGSRIAIRGLGARAAFGVRGIRILQDGIPLTMPDGQSNLNNIDLGAAGRIEVLRGPASSLYGNAAGGVIAIETEDAPATPFAGEARVLYGDLGRDQLDRLRKLQLKLGGRFGGGDWLVSGARLDTEGFRDHSSAEQSTLNARVRLDTGERSRFTIVLNAADAPVAQNPGSLPIDSAEQKPSMAWPRNAATRAGEAASQIQGGVSWRLAGATGGLTASVYALRRELDNPLPFAYIAIQRNGAGARAAYDRELAAAGRTLALTIGFDAEFQRDARTEFNNVEGRPGSQRNRDQIDRVTGFGPFAQASWFVARDVELSAGLRFDAVRFRTDDRQHADGRDDSGERTLSALSPRIAVLWSPASTVSTYATVATAFQTPTTTELINAPPAAGQPCCPGGFNQNLEPQRAVSLETGIKGILGPRLRYEVALFQMTLRDALVPFQVASVEGREFFRNTGKTRHRGLEAAGTAVLARWASATASYAFSDFTFLDDGIPTANYEGNALPGVPPHHALVRVRLQPFARAAVELEHEWTSAYETTDSNADNTENPAASVVDVRAEWTLSRGGALFRPFIGLNNVFDQRYNSSVVINAAGARYYEPAPGRNLYLGASVGLGH